MSKLSRHAPMVVALMALFFAIGGPSFAADAVNSTVKLITGKQVKDSSLTTKDIKNGSLLKADFKAGQLPAGAHPKGDTGAAGTNGTNGANGTNGTSVTSANELAGANCATGGSKFTSANGETYACNGAKGDQGAPGTARGYARVGGDGTLVLAQSKNVDRVLKVGSGAYCVNFTFNPDNVIATLDFGDVGQVNAGPSFCSANSGTYNAQVRTFDSAGTLADHSFFIMGN